MDRAELRTLISTRAQSDPAFAQSLASRSDTDIASAISTGRTKLVATPVTELDVLSVLGMDDGEAFLVALETFSAANLPGNHPLKTKQPGMKRALSWLKSVRGLDLGNPLVQQLLTVMGAAGVVNAKHAATLAASAVKPDPITYADVGAALSEG